MIPEHLKYAPTHEWFHVESKSITVGLTKHIVDELNKLLFLDLPKVGGRNPCGYLLWRT